MRWQNYYEFTEMPKNATWIKSWRFEDGGDVRGVSVPAVTEKGVERKYAAAIVVSWVEKAFDHGGPEFCVFPETWDGRAISVAFDASDRVSPNWGAALTEFLRGCRDYDYESEEG